MKKNMFTYCFTFIFYINLVKYFLLTTYNYLPQQKSDFGRFFNDTII